MHGLLAVNVEGLSYFGGHSCFYAFVALESCSGWVVHRFSVREQECGDVSCRCARSVVQDPEERLLGVSPSTNGSESDYGSAGEIEPGCDREGVLSDARLSVAPA